MLREGCREILSSNPQSGRLPLLSIPEAVLRQGLGWDQSREGSVGQQSSEEPGGSSLAESAPEGAAAELCEELCEGCEGAPRTGGQLWGSGNEGHSGHLQGALLYRDQTPSPL